jgi:crotonobetainyl-CoA:carnitine CoA-transferase CaiB-like acyl-CoA transferase
MAEALRVRSTADWLERLDAEQVPCAPVLRREELAQFPQIVENRLLDDTPHPHAGPMRQPRPAAHFDRTPAGIQRPAPQLGEHTDELLRELGCSPEEIAHLREHAVAG